MNDKALNFIMRYKIKIALNYTIRNNVGHLEYNFVRELEIVFLLRHERGSTIYFRRINVDLVGKETKV